MEGVLLDWKQRLNAVVFEAGNHSLIGQVFTQLTIAIVNECSLVLGVSVLLLAFVGLFADSLVEMRGVTSFRHL